MIRDSSPPEAASRSGDAGIPGLVATRSSTVSEPFGPKPSGWGCERHLERCPFHGQLGELGRDPLRELAGGLCPRRAELPAKLRAPPAHLIEFGAPARRRPLLGVLEPVDLGSAALPVGEHRLDRSPVLARQAVDRVQALLDQLEAAGLGLDRNRCRSAARSPHRRARRRPRGLAPRSGRARGRRRPPPPGPPRPLPAGRARRPGRPRLPRSPPAPPPRPPAGPRRGAGDRARLPGRAPRRGRGRPPRSPPARSEAGRGRAPSLPRARPARPARATAPPPRRGRAR